MNIKLSNSAIGSRVWRSFLFSAMMAVAALVLYSAMAGGVHRLAGLWLSERLHGASSEHAGWFYTRYSPAITEQLELLVDYSPLERERATPDRIAAATCSTHRLGGVTFAFPVGFYAWGLAVVSSVMLLASVLIVVLIVKETPYYLCRFAAGTDAATSAWRRFSCLRMCAVGTHRITMLAAGLAAPCAAFLVFDRLHEDLTNSLGYALPLRVLVWYWGLILGMVLLVGSAVAIGWCCVWVYQRLSTYRALCAMCGYQAMDGVVCSECGSAARVQPLRARAKVASIVMLGVSMSIASMIAVRYWDVAMLLHRGSVSYKEPSNMYTRDAARALLWGVFKQRMYFPEPWLDSWSHQEAWHRFWFRDGGIALESARYRVTVVPDGEGVLLVAEDLNNGTRWTQWTHEFGDKYGSTYILEPVVFDIGLLEIVVEVPNPGRIEELDLPEHERASILTIVPATGWSVVEPLIDSEHTPP